MISKFFTTLKKWWFAWLLLALTVTFASFSNSPFLAFFFAVAAMVLLLILMLLVDRSENPLTLQTMFGQTLFLGFEISAFFDYGGSRRLVVGVEEGAMWHPLVSLALFVGGSCLAAIFVYPANTERFVYRMSLILLALAVSLLHFATIYSELGIVGSDGELITGLSDCLYFSVVTWTTLGFGDFTPSEASRMYAAIEALMGYTFMAIVIGLAIREVNFFDDRRA